MHAGLNALQRHAYNQVILSHAHCKQIVKSLPVR